MMFMINNHQKWLYSLLIMAHAVFPMLILEDTMQSDISVINCPQCGQTNNHNRRSCWNCGLPFVSRRKFSLKRILIIILLDIFMISLPLLFVIYASSDNGQKTIQNYFKNIFMKMDATIKDNHKL